MISDYVFSLFSSSMEGFSNYLPLVGTILLIIIFISLIVFFIYIIFILIKKLPLVTKKIFLLFQIISALAIKTKLILFPKSKKQLLNASTVNFGLEYSNSKYSSFRKKFFGFKRPDLPLSLCIWLSPDRKYKSSLKNESMGVYLDIDSSDHAILHLPAESLNHEYISSLLNELKSISPNKPYDDIVLILDQVQLKTFNYSKILTYLSGIEEISGYGVPVSFVLNMDRNYDVNRSITKHLSIEESRSISCSATNEISFFSSNTIPSWFKDIGFFITECCSDFDLRDAEVEFSKFSLWYSQATNDLMFFLAEINKLTTEKSNLPLHSSIFSLNFPVSTDSSFSNNIFRTIVFHNVKNSVLLNTDSSIINSKISRRIKIPILAVTTFFVVGSIYLIYSTETYAHIVKLRTLDEKLPFELDSNYNRSFLISVSNFIYIDKNKPHHSLLPIGISSATVGEKMHTYLERILTKEVKNRLKIILDEFVLQKSSLNILSISSEEDINRITSEVIRNKRFIKIITGIEASSSTELAFADLWFLLNNSKESVPVPLDTDIDWSYPVPRSLLSSIKDLPLGIIVSTLSIRNDYLVTLLTTYKIKNVFLDNKFDIAVNNLNVLQDKIKSSARISYSEQQYLRSFLGLFNPSSLSPEDKVLLGDENSAQLFFSTYIGKLVSDGIISLEQSVLFAKEIRQRHTEFQSKFTNLKFIGVGNIIEKGNNEPKLLRPTQLFNDFVRQWDFLFTQFNSLRILMGDHFDNDQKPIIPSSSSRNILSFPSQVSNLLELAESFKNISNSGLTPFDPMIAFSLNKILTKDFRDLVLDAFRSNIIYYNSEYNLTIPSSLNNYTDLNPNNKIQNITRDVQILIQLSSKFPFLENDLKEIGKDYASLIEKILQSRRDYVIKHSNFKLSISYIKSLIVNINSDISNLSVQLNDNYNSDLNSLESALDDVKPIIALINSSKIIQINNSLFNFWNLILNQLDLYNNSSGPFIEFRNFIFSYPDLIVSSDCSYKKSESLESHILLMNSYKILRDDLNLACKSLKRNNLTQRVNGFINEFNLRFLSKSPFHFDPKSPPISRSQFDDIRSRFNELKPSFDLVANSLPNDSLIFIKSLNRFFSLHHSSESDEPISFNISVDTNKSNLVLPHLIEISLQVGSNTYNLRSKSNKIKWNYSDVIKLKLRVAANSKYKLSAKNFGSDSFISNADNSIEYKFIDLWSFYTFLRYFANNDQTTNGKIFKISLPLTSEDNFLTLPLFISISDSKDNLPYTIFRDSQILPISSSSLNIYSTNETP